jgi:hydroxyacylglutathione hydrolase
VKTAFQPCQRASILRRQPNPFLRVDNAAIRAHLGMETASNAAVFAEIRKRKDHF